MDLKETISTAFDALFSNKLRTGLAILGIVIGIGSVVALLTLGQGAQQAVTDSISTLGSNLLTVSPGATRERGVQGASGSASTLTLEDAEAISKAGLNSVSAVSAEVSRNYQIAYRRNNTNARVSGVSPSYAQIHNSSLQYGAFFTTNDVNGLSKKAILGSTVATDLFGTANPVGQTVEINNISFRVIGVMASKGGNGFFSEDEMVLVPISTAQKILLGSDYVQSISVAAKSSDLMDQATTEVQALLLSRHHIRSADQADFSIRSQADILSTATSATSTFTNLLSGIAAISLLVGGIGIMNIMLVTITERTHEIGIRKAIGAKRRDILSQFIIESIVLTLVGGLLGIVLGYILSFVGGKFLSIPFTLTLSAPLLAFSVSSGIGIIFGYYPARRAALLQPIQALRYE